MTEKCQEGRNVWDEMWQTVRDVAFTNIVRLIETNKSIADGLLVTRVGGGLVSIHRQGNHTRYA